jgi:hypothetical protein
MTSLAISLCRIEIFKIGKIMNVFISHISEEASIAIILKRWIESSFLGMCRVFVSSDSNDIPAGSKWLDIINRELEKSGLLIILCSPESVNRPWINFEAGCGSIKKIPIIPLCYSGLKIESLIPPISIFQSIEITNCDSLKKLFLAIANYIGISQLPNISYNDMIDELKKQIESNCKLKDKKNNDFKKHNDEIGTIDDLMKELNQKVSGIPSKLIQEGFSELSNYKETVKEDQRAAEWVEMQKKQWAERATSFTTEKYPNILNSQNKRRNFCQDICKYLDWLSQSLSYGDYKDSGVITSIKFSLPYKTALSFVRDIDDWDDLTPQSVIGLRHCIDYLIHNII